MNVYALGASRNIGYYSSVRFLEQGGRVTFLLRNPSGLEKDEALRPYIQSGHAQLVKGDAVVAEDVAKGWAVALEDGQRPVDLVLSTVGTVPSFSFTKGFYLDPPNLCIAALLNVLSTYPAPTLPTPKFVTLSSIGITPESHSLLPLPLRLLYGTSMLKPAHDDKIGSERVAVQAAGQAWPASFPAIKEGLLPEGWEQTLAQNGVVWKETVILKPAFLTDGACKGDAPKAGKPPYRISTEDFGNGYSVSRKDVAHFIVEGLMKDFDTWSGKMVNIAY